MITPRLALVGAVMLTASAAGWSSDVATAAPPALAAVRLSITVTDGAAFVHRNMTAEYRATVTNQGSRPARGTLVLAAPQYVRYQHVRGNGKITSGEVRWKITVGAGQAVTERVTVRVRAIPESALRVTTLASFYLGAVTGPPVIRTADADHIPGVTDPAPVSVPHPTAPRQPRGHAATASGSATRGTFGWTLGGGGALVLLLSVAVVARRWRRRGRGSGSDSRQRRVDRDPEDDLVDAGLQPSGGDA